MAQCVQPRVFCRAIRFDNVGREHRWDKTALKYVWMTFDPPRAVRKDKPTPWASETPFP
jgi:hypothetical protein